MDLKLEVVVVPVSDVDEANGLDEPLGWRLDAVSPVTASMAVTTRRADTRRVDRSPSAGGAPMPASYDSASGQAATLRVADAHGPHQEPDPVRPGRSAQSKVDEQCWFSGQTSPGAVA